jgi:hypothetical protein
MSTKSLMILTLSRPTCNFLLAVGESWGVDWLRTLAREIKAGTFTHLEGEPCMVEIEEPAQASREIQLRLGEEAA